MVFLGGRSPFLPLLQGSKADSITNVTSDGRGGAFAITASGGVVNWALPDGVRNARTAAGGRPQAASMRELPTLKRWGSGGTPAMLSLLAGRAVRAIAACSGMARVLLCAEGDELFQWEPESRRQDGAALPYPVKGLPDRRVLRLACGNAHCLALVATESGFRSTGLGPGLSGEVYSWGRGAEGQLGHALDDDDDDLRKTLTGSARGLENPMLIETLSGLPTVDVQCGPDFSAVLLASGSVWTWGKNDDLQLGQRPEYAQSPEGRNLSLKTAWVPGEAEMPPDSPVVQITCGDAHMAALTDDGAIVCWGNGESGQLGRGKNRIRPWPAGAPDVVESGYLPEAVNVVSIVCGPRLCSAFLADGSVFAWGRAGEFFQQFPTQVRSAQPGAPRLLAATAAGDALLLVG